MDISIEELHKSLSEKGLTEDQIRTIIEEIRILNEKTEKANEAAEASAEELQNSIIFSLINKFLDNNPNITNIFKPNLWNLLFRFLIVGILVGSIVYLSYIKVFSASEASTLLGGIVGYMLGNSTR